MGFTAWPNVTDDDGSGQSGTVFDDAWVDALKASIEDDVFSAANPAISPEDIIDEVVDARGTQPSLTGRLDVSLELNGDLIIPSTLPTKAAVQAGLGAVNLIQNDQFLIWPAGDTLAPAGWALSGAGGTIVRTGTGLVDTNRKHGKFAAKVTAALDVKTILSQTLLDSAVIADGSFFNRKISAGVRAKATVASRVTISISDGVTETTSTPHSGSGAGGDDADGWEWLSVTHTISASATTLEVRLNIATGISTSAYWSGVTCLLTELAPSKWHPALTYTEDYNHFVTGAQTAATFKAIFSSPRMGLILDTTLLLSSAPAGAGDTVIDVNTWDGAAWTTAYTTKITIPDAAIQVSQAPDGTYARRCLSGSAGAVHGAGGAISVDIDSISATPGTDLAISVRVLRYQTPIEALRAYNDV